MTPQQDNKRAPNSLIGEVYAQIMNWLETGQGPTGSTRQVLSVAVSSGTRTLRFRRRDGMGGLVWAESMDAPDVEIHYDPNWNALQKIEGLLKR